MTQSLKKMNKYTPSNYSKSLKRYVFRNLFVNLITSYLMISISYSKQYDLRISYIMITLMFLRLIYSVYKNYHNQVLQIEYKEDKLYMTVENIFTRRKSNLTIENEPELNLKYHISGDKLSMNQFSEFNFYYKKGNSKKRLSIRSDGWGLLPIYFFIRQKLKFPFPSELLISLREIAFSKSDSVEFVKKELNNDTFYHSPPAPQDL